LCLILIVKKWFDVRNTFIFYEKFMTIHCSSTFLRSRRAPIEVDFFWSNIFSSTYTEKNYISISFQIEWDMIMVTVFLSILNQIEFHLVQNRKENCHPPRSYPIQCERKWKQSFLSVHSREETSFLSYVRLFISDILGIYIIIIVLL